MHPAPYPIVGRAGKSGDAPDIGGTRPWPTRLRPKTAFGTLERESPHLITALAGPHVVPNAEVCAVRASLKILCLIANCEFATGVSGTIPRRYELRSSKLASPHLRVFCLRFVENKAGEISG